LKYTADFTGLAYGQPPFNCGETNGAQEGFLSLCGRRCPFLDVKTIDGQSAGDRQTREFQVFGLCGKGWAQNYSANIS